MKLYTASRPPSPRRARIALAEKGIQVEMIELDLAKGEHLWPPYLSVNPRGLTPALQLDDGAVITEGLAIASYLEAIQPEPPLMGQTPLEKARVLEWAMIVETEGFAAVAEAWRNSHPVFAGRALNGPVNYDQIPALAERGIKRIAQFYATLERRLGESAYLAGDNFTWADISAGVIVEFARVAKQDIPDSAPHVALWRAGLAARPSWTA